MPTKSDPGEVRFVIPPRLLKAFVTEPRVIIKWRPDGLWPIGPEILEKINLKELAADPEFQKNFEIVIMPK
jgi:hypothetical protein